MEFAVAELYETDFLNGMKLFPQGNTACEEAVLVVKGISKQVIVVHSPEPKFFEQAIFILKDGQPAVTDEALLKEAYRLMNMPAGRNKRKLWLYGPVWAGAGALVTGLAWLVFALL